MANHTDTETMSEHMDQAEHEKTWKLFTTLVKWGTISMVVLMVFLYIAINP